VSVNRFIDDDDGYLAWKVTHPSGLILNCERSPRAAYLTLHSPDCRSLATLPPGYEHWTRDYIKICGETIGDIEAWISANVPDGLARECQLCLA
jgi:hypothetical protein